MVAVPGEVVPTKVKLMTVEPLEIAVKLPPVVPRELEAREKVPP
jgi:hypothetical protein